MKKIMMFVVLVIILGGYSSTLTGCRAKKPSAKIADGYKKKSKKVGKRFDRSLKKQEKKRK